MPIFDPASLHTAVNQALAAADPGPARNAFAVVATTDGVKGVIATRLNGAWTIAAMVAVDHDAHVEAGCEIKAVW